MSINRQNYPKYSPKFQNKTNFWIWKFFWEGSIFANFRTVFPILSLFLKNAKIAIKWALFSLRGGSKNFFRPNSFFNSFYIPKWSQKKLLGNIIFSRWIFIPILGFFYLKLKKYDWKIIIFGQVTYFSDF